MEITSKQELLRIHISMAKDILGGAKRSQKILDFGTCERSGKRIPVPIFKILLHIIFYPLDMRKKEKKDLLSIKNKEKRAIVEKKGNFKEII